MAQTISEHCGDHCQLITAWIGIDLPNKGSGAERGLSPCRREPLRF